MNYDVAALRKFIFDHFNDEELTTLCQEYFPDVYKNFAAGQTFRQRIQLLLDDCLRSERQMERLVGALQRERPYAYEAAFPETPQVTPPPPGPQPPDPPPFWREMWQKAAGAPLWGWGVLALLVLLAFGLLNGLGGEATPRPEATSLVAGVTATATMTPTSQPTGTATELPSPEPTGTAAPTATPSATPSPTLSPTVTRDPNLPPLNPEAGDTWTRPIDGMEMVYIPAGNFLMGSDPSEDPDADDDESPQRLVALDGFWMDRTEVTNAMYARFLNEMGNQEEEGVTWLEIGSSDALIEEQADEFLPKAGFAGHPVVEVSWYGAQAYCQWAGGRLPTEAQWEYGARGEDGRLYPWGDDPPTCDLAQFDECDGRTVPVGSFSPEGDSPFGLADMAGNVWEWTADWYDPDYYENGLTNNPPGPPSGDRKVLRGGSWLNFVNDVVRAASRNYNVPTNRSNLVGFRCAQE
jgi:formylglycine-generating enzyme required for sulfatase activity